jgi:hypothetical protein
LGVHRAGSTLNVHTHFHILVVDGVYIHGGDGQGEEGDGVTFQSAPPPSREELRAMLEHIYTRTMKWLARHDLLRRPDESNAAAEMSPSEVVTTFGMQRGTLVTMREGEPSAGDAGDAVPPPPRPSDAVVHERFNLHASDPLRADDDVGRERLCRYLTRPAFALGRIRILRDGKVAYRVKRVSRNRVTERVMAPVEFLARLASLVAPPRYPLLRLHGVLAPRHRWRPRIVPKPRSPRPAGPRTNDEDACVSDCPRPKARPCPRPKDDARSLGPEPGVSRPPGDGEAAFAIPKAVPTASLTRSGDAERLGPNILSADHWHRLLDGELYASSSRPEWALLLRRTFDVDVRDCVRCGGRLVLHTVVTDAATVNKIVAALSRARDSPNAA